MDEAQGIETSRRFATCGILVHGRPRDGRGLPSPHLDGRRRSPSRPTAFRSTRRPSSSSRRASGRSWRRGARGVTGRRSRRAACGSTRGRRSWPGATTGPAVVPGNAEGEPAGRRDQLRRRPTRCRRSRSSPTEEIATLTRWVEMGAPWGVDDVRRAGDPVARSPGRPISRRHFQRAGPALVLPADPPGHASRRATDAGAGRETRSIASSWPGSTSTGSRRRPEADRRTLIRRVTFDLTGLPPTPGEVAAFLADPSPDAYERLVDRLLASPHYGERWARHWLDLVRYAETAGHEFDYDIPNAFRYRDYVIRALNADLPYDQFVIEQLAGDLLDAPAAASGRAVQRVDPRDRLLLPRRGDAFAGRRPRGGGAADRQPDRRHLQDLPGPDRRLRPLPRSQVRPDHARRTTTPWPASSTARGISRRSSIRPSGSRRGQPARAAQGGDRAVLRRGRADAARADPGRSRLATRRSAPCAATPADGERTTSSSRTSTATTYDGWYVTGDAFGDRPSRGGRLSARASTGEPPRLIRSRPAWRTAAWSPTGSQGVLRSRTFTIENRYIHYLVAGRGRTDQRRRRRLREDPRPDLRRPDDRPSTSAIEPRWITQDVGMWLGHTAYLEIADGADRRLSTGPRPQLHDGHGYIAVDEIRMSDRPRPPRRRTARAGSIDLDAVDRGAATRRDSRLADRLRRRHRPSTARSRRRSPTRRWPWRSPMGPAMDEHVLIRGNHKNPGEVVPRRFLEVLGGAGLGRRPPRAAAGSSWPGGWSTPGQSAHCPRAGQPALEAPLRRGDRQVDRRLRRDGTEAQPSRAARLAGRRVRRRRLVDQGDAPADRHVEHLPDVERPDRRGRAARPDERATCTG